MAPLLIAFCRLVDAIRAIGIEASTATTITAAA